MENNSPEVVFKRLGSTGEKISALGLGTYGIKNYKKGVEAFVYAIDRGIDLIDTAEIYNTEDFVGEVIRRVGRERLFITTKISPKNLVSKDDAIKAARGSLKRMGISNVDLELIHWPNRNMSIEEQIRNIESVHKAGLTRYIGVSNFSVEQLEEARNSTVSTEIVCNQVKYNLEERQIENDVLPYCEKNGMTVVAYTPINGNKPSSSDSLMKLTEVTGKSPIQISLNFLMSRQNVVPIPKTEDIEHMKEIMGSFGWKLTKSQIDLLG